ncbi:MAG: DinB family protein [Acidimicrobiales bacterium]
MPIVPDGKDWTWVLSRPCPECGLDTRDIGPEEIPRYIGGNAAAWAAALGRRSPEELRARPSDDRWSALEHACHVRDVLRLAGERLHLMLDVDDPTFPNWDQDAVPPLRHSAAVSAARTPRSPNRGMSSYRER